MHLADTQRYGLYLVLLALVIMILASYTSLNLTRRIAVSSAWAQKLWISCSAATLGVGIWSMHFIAMLACPLPIGISYDINTLFTSMAVAVIGSVIGFFVTNCAKKLEIPKFLLGGMFMGLSISGMHFIGMGALHHVEIHYFPIPFVLTIVIAILASIITLYRSANSNQSLLSSALVSSIALTGMHYTGMFAAQMTYPDISLLSTNQEANVDVLVLAMLVAFGTVIFLSICMICSLKIDQKLAEQSTLKATLLDTSIDCIMMFNSRGWIIECNPAAAAAFGYTRKQALSLTMFDFLFPFDRNGEAAASLFQQLARQDTALIGKRIEMLAYRADRSEFPAEITITGFQFKGKQVFAATIRNLAEQCRPTTATAS
ncbi:MHYT domain-containing protein [Paenibacillus aceris]|uniref:PAS domain S-box-containing protein n=1 Tax=Paenibacillus aceris TaxID=869555 RepID=A0ABS4HU71_9BACL|nr:MHYT domain-containing protein [Paenibacillus aceris]MBP1962159.1 PAS domain S-box-containing protein [Paenibacillus aceris]NHW33993.1 PAS domain-containing protein [Paenibacillus aceris]